MNRPLILGVLNITPDSFSDGGEFVEPESALNQARKLVNEGANILDVGGESTRPGAERISIATEISRVIPVIEQLRELKCPISIDTMNSETAEAAVASGATIINDVSGGKNDPSIFEVAAKHQTVLIISHWRGHSIQMDSLNSYEDIAKDVAGELKQQVHKAIDAGVSKGKIVIDPGLGFSKDVEQNWELLSRLDELQQLGFPILIGASRKRFVAARLDVPDSLEARDLATARLNAELNANYKIWGFRVHNVAATVKLLGQN